MRSAEAVAGGDDYELAFTVRPKEARRLKAVLRAADGLQTHADRRRDPDAGCWLVDAERRRTPIGPGYEHFSR